MAELQKQAIDVSFAQGLDQKTDPKRVQVGKFLSLENSVFQKGGLLQKRNGYGLLPALPDTTYSHLTTLNGNLTAVGSNIAALNAGGESWVQRGAIQPLTLTTLPLLRNNLNQNQCDAAVAPNGLVCTAYLETDGTTTTAKYVIADSVTGQNIVAPAVIPVSSGTVTGGMRVFVLGTHFVIVFTNVITATSHLQYVAISYNNTALVGANTDIAASYISATTLAWDGYVAGSNLYLAYNTTSGGQAIKVTYLSQSLVLATAVTFSSYKATVVSLTADTTGSSPTVYVSFYRSDTSVGHMLAVDQSLNTIFNPVYIITAGSVLSMTSAAQNGACTAYYELANNYGYDGAVPTHYISAVTVTPTTLAFSSIFAAAAGTITVSSATGLSNGMFLIDNTTAGNIAAGTSFTVSGTTLTLSVNTAGNSASSPGDSLTAVSLSHDVTSSAPTPTIRSVGLASKAFIVGGVEYFLAAYQSPYQPTYFLVNATASVQTAPVLAGKLAYQNGGGYLAKGLPGVTLDGATARLAYLFKDQIQAANKDTNVPSGTQTAGIYSQTGVNLVSFTLGTDGLDTAEIGSDLHLTGGFLWMYDGYLPVEHNFFLYPDSIETSTSTGAGGLVAQDYYYQVTYEWTDNQGNAFRSAPSIPVKQTTTTASSTNTVHVPSLRLTAKTANPVKIVVYRWSTAQQVYYQTTSISVPTLNSLTVDSVDVTDANSDATILGNNILYTNGGVIEDLNAPAAAALALFDTRLWLIDAENPDTLWFSKQVIPATPVEMSDVLTVFVPPTTGTETSTGPNRTIFPLDDKLIIGRKAALLYINGTGPDNAGNNNQYSQPIFITSTVGCDNQASWVLMPEGLMFQSDKGIWLLDRGLNTSYIGAPVEDFTTGATVLSAVNVPGTNQVRFTLDSGVTLMYDYFYGQWGTFVGVPCVSSCIYQSLHAFIDSHGRAFKETPGAYLDGSRPVLMSFKTGPIRLGDLQGYQRAYFFYLLGDYISPHKLAVNVFYNYATAPSSGLIISPDNATAVYGSGPSPYGQENPYGGPGVAEEWRVFFKDMRCKAVSIAIQEIFDPSFGTPAGAGLTLSGLNVVLGFKKGYVPISAARSAGSN